jgi:hypothetical protein
MRMAAANADTNKTASEDLAFMRALAEDGDPLPPRFGAQLFATGLIWGPVPLFVWAVLSGLIHAPSSWIWQAWIPAVIIQAPISFLLQRNVPPIAMGPSRRTFAGAWSAVGIMSATILVALLVASARSGFPLMYAWPPVAFALYGGAWAMMAFVRGDAWCGWLAIACLATAIVCAWFTTRPEEWLVLGLGLWAWIAAPGFAIMRRPKRAEA